MRTRLAADGTLLATRHWDPAGRPRSTVVLVHGLGEHGGRYQHVGEMLAAPGDAGRGAQPPGAAPPQPPPAPHPWCPRAPPIPSSRRGHPWLSSASPVWSGGTSPNSAT